jgi:CheY-like chemotaxis protein
LNVKNQFFYETTVLIVDDDTATTDLMHILLTEHGAYVQTACSGTEALLRVAECHPHAIITDIAMPEMDGWSLIHSLKSRAATADIPIIVVSAFDSADVRARAAGLGCVDYLTKPIHPQTFATHLSKTLGFDDNITSD